LKRSVIPSLVIILAGTIVLAGTWAFAVPPGSEEQIIERVKPFGNVCRAGEDCGVAAAGASSGSLSGQQVYDKYCFVCHASGVGGAPIFGDSEAWQPRIAKGMDELMNTTLNGLNAMPAKGTCMGCSDDELNGAVDYMLEQVQ